MKDTYTHTLLSEMPLEVDGVRLKESLGRLPAWRRMEAEAYRQPIDKLQSATAYLLLCQLMGEATGREVSPQFAYGAEGKPYMPDFPHLHFNMSHCQRAVMCMLGTGAAVGCDVEEIPAEIDRDIMPLCFSPEERERIAQAENPRVEFTRLWTQKEALAKLYGTGLTDNIPQMLHTPQARNAEFHTVVCAERGYVYTTCRRK